jgi:non-specific serine/threonine protein kinase/serine/threonine-protein kinase
MAERRFKEVRQLANTLIFKIHDAVTPLAGSTPVRRTIVDEATAYLERLEQESNGDESLQLELAAAYRQIGSILGDPGRPNLGDRDGALRHYERARKLVLPLASRPNPTPASVLSLVNADLLLVPVHRQRNGRDQATATAREAVEYAQRLVTRLPDDPDAKNLAARAAFSLAGTMQGEASVPYWQRTVALFDALLAERPDDPGRQRNAALAEKYFGGVFDALNRDEEASPHYARALALDEKRYQATPEDRTVQFDMAIDLANMAVMMDDTSPAEAYALYSRSLALRRGLSESDPNDVLARGRVGHVHMKLARLDLAAKRLVAAFEHAQAAVAAHEAVFAKTKDGASRRDLADAMYILGGVEAARGNRAASCTAYARSHQLFSAELNSVDFTNFGPQAAEQARACTQR